MNIGRYLEMQATHEFIEGRQLNRRGCLQHMQQARLSETIRKGKT